MCDCSLGCCYIFIKWESDIPSGRLDSATESATIPLILDFWQLYCAFKAKCLEINTEEKKKKELKKNQNRNSFKFKTWLFLLKGCK